MNEQEIILPLKAKLKKAQMETGRTWEVIERDYFLSFVLNEIAQQSSLNLIFKGGTALKKCYFKDYRYSEDLDFTALSSLERNFDRAIESIAEKVENTMNKFTPIKVFFEKYSEKNPHPLGQEAYILRAQFEWQREPLTKVFIEISKDEELIWLPVKIPIYHEYGELFQTKILAYSLKEIIVEKLRAILQHTKKIHEREWTRSRARDYYDLWRIFSEYPQYHKIKNFREALVKKCNLKDVMFHSVSSFFEEKMINFVEKTWDRWLFPLVPNLPDSKLVISEVKRYLSVLIRDE